MVRSKISVTIITFNEERHIERAILSAQWADEVLIVDSGSSDRTREIAEAMGAKVFQNSWPGYGAQKNFAQEKASNDWILNLDADEEITPDLKREIIARTTASSEVQPQVFGFDIPRKTYFGSKWIRHGGWYPNYVTRLAHRKYARWSEPTLHECLKVEGVVERLANPMNHFTFGGAQEQVVTNLRYAEEGAREILRKRPNLSKSHVVVALVFKPVWKFFSSYCIQLGFLDGVAGLVIAWNSAHSMMMKYALVFEKLNQGQTSK